ncbi:MAG TPA: hypothetical protein VF865_15960 [Acidobacteriaceae bacterium]
MPRKPSPRTLATVFLLVSATLSIVLLGVRNLYDDEISSLEIVTSTARDILRFAAQRDVHPPGMYLLAHLAYSIIPSFRWMDLFPLLILYLGLTVFLFQVIPFFAHMRSQFFLLLLATLHPQLLMWSNTFRWYSWWTGIALITLTTALQPGNPTPTLSKSRSLTIGLMLACLFYLNYITLLFALALSVAILFRYRKQSWKIQLPSILITLGVFLTLIAPQLRTMFLVHLPNGRGQRSGHADSFLRLLLSVSASEAYLPWHPFAILAIVLSGALSVCALIALLRLYRNSRPESSSGDANELSATLASIILFGLLFFLLVAASGLGGKPRNGLLLIPVLAPAIALIAETLRPRAQNAILIFLSIWIGVGAAHLLGRYGLTKATMNDRPEQVVAFIAQTSGSGCAIVVTYDATLAFSVAQADLPRVLIISPFPESTFGGFRRLPANGCARTRLYAVQSYLGGDDTVSHTLNGELHSATQFIESPPRTDSFSFDPDAARKRATVRIPRLHGDLASAARLPDYRYVVTSGDFDQANVEVMRKGLPHFLGGSE